jgi:hypothetical protein
MTITHSMINHIVTWKAVQGTAERCKINPVGTLTPTSFYFMGGCREWWHTLDEDLGSGPHDIATLFKFVLYCQAHPADSTAFKRAFIDPLPTPEAKTAEYKLSVDCIRRALNEPKWIHRFGNYIEMQQYMVNGGELHSYDNAQAEREKHIADFTSHRKAQHSQDTSTVTATRVKGRTAEKFRSIKSLDDWDETTRFSVFDYTTGRSTIVNGSKAVRSLRDVHLKRDIEMFQQTVPLMKNISFAGQQLVVPNDTPRAVTKTVADLMPHEPNAELVAPTDF